MSFKLIIDENMPFQVVKVLRNAGYDVVTVSEVAHPGIKNDMLAELSIELERIIVTRDADFTHLRRSLMTRVKVVYVRLSGDPDRIAEHVLSNIDKCVNILQSHNVVVLDEEGVHAF